MTTSSSIFVNPWSEPSAMVSPFLAESLPNPYRTQMTPSQLGGPWEDSMTPEQRAATAASLARIMDSPWWIAYRVASVVGGVLGLVHGFKRNNSSVGWAIGWGILGGMFPLITIPIALLQGFGKPKAKTNRRRRNGRGRTRHVAVLVKKPLKELRRMQGLVAAQIRSAWEQGERSPSTRSRLEPAVRELQQRERELSAAIEQREFGPRRRNPYVVERYGALIKAPSEDAARGIAERRMAAGETWTRILRVSPDGRTTVVGRYGRQEGGRGAIARRMNRRKRRRGSR